MANKELNLVVFIKFRTKKALVSKKIEKKIFFAPIASSSLLVISRKENFVI